MTSSVERQPLDPAVIARAQQGSVEAFETIVAARLTWAWRLARAIGREDVDADDIVQESFLIVWRDLPALRAPAAFDPWLRAIVVNVIRHAVRARAHVRSISFDPPLDRATHPRGLVDPDSIDRSIADRDRLDRALARLSVDERAVRVLLHVDGCTIEEIANAIGRPAGTVKSRLASARSSLRAALDAEDR
jgi:RNA polymerase sigma-70 factor, ECF subfamily